MKFGKIACLAVGILLSFSHVYAGGVLLYEMGTPEVGLAAAGWAARAQDAATVATNPAGMTRLSQNELLIGAQLLYADVEFTPDSRSTSGGGDGGNPIGFFPAASTFYSHSYSDRLKLGLGVYGNFGAALDYDSDWVGRYFFQEGTLIGMTVAPTLAYKVTDRLSLGAALNLMYGIFSTTVAVNNPSPGLPDGQAELEDTRWGFGGNFGVLYELSDTTRFGLQYTTEIALDFEDTIDFSGLGPGMTTALQAAGLLDAEIALDMTVPQTAMASFYHQLGDRWALLGNLGWQDWSEYGKVGVRVDARNTKDITKERDYDDSWHTALGAQYDMDGPWLLTFGTAFDSGIIDKATPDLPNGDAWRFAVGGKYAIKANMELGLGYTLLWMGDLDVDQQGGPLSGRLAGTYEGTSMHFFAVNFRIFF